MIDADETFGGTWPFTANFFDGQGFKHHYIDEGPQDTGETFVLLHGEPTWGYIYRKFVSRLTTLGRVVVPDHMGFGKSETPQDREYSSQDHCENLAALLLDLDLDGVTLIMQDWGGPIGTHFAFNHPDRIKRAFYIDSLPCVGIPAGIDMAVLAEQGNTPWAQFFTSESFEPVMSHLSQTILSVLKTVGFQNNDIITPDWIRAYASPFPTIESTKGAKAFPLANLSPDTFAYFAAAMKADGAVDALRAKPAMSVLGEEDKTLPEIMAKGMFREIWPDAQFLTLPGVGHYAQEDAPDRLLAMIEQFVSTH